MFTPRLHAQLLRNPAMVDVGPLLGERFQLRLGASFSPLDAVRGGRTLRVGRADCQLHDSGERARRLVAAPMDALLVPAYRAQLAAFRSTEAEREALMKQAEERLRQKLITLIEYHDIQRLADELRSKQLASEGELARLEAEGVEPPTADLHALAQAYQDDSARFEREARKLRALDAWTVRISGGAIPTKQEDLDWYGWLELSYSLGGPFRPKYENRYEEARRQEVAKAKYELPQRVQLLSKQVQARFVQAQAELSVVERNLGFIDTTLRSLGQADVPNINHARDSLALQRLTLLAEQAYLQALLQTLTPLRSE